MDTVLQKGGDFRHCIVQSRAGSLNGYLWPAMLNRVAEIVVHDYTGIAPQPNGLAQVDTAALLPSV